MTSLQSKSAGAVLAALGTRGHSGITCAAHDGDATRLDITIESGAWAVLADGTVLADELASTHISGLSIAGNYRLWLDYREVAAAYEPVWTLTSITPTPPTSSALDICTVDVGAGGISAIGATEGGLRSLPQQTSTATLPAGVPVLRGPYVVDYTDIPHDGDTKVLWTPQVGDVLLRVFPDFRTVVQWTHGQLWLAQGLPDNENNFLAGGQPGYIANADNPSNLDTERALISGGAMIDGADLGAPYMCRNTQPMTVLFRNASPFGDGIDPTQGHVELYALIAGAVRP